MRQRACQSCGHTFSLSTTFVVNGDVLCEPCADNKVIELRKAKLPLQVRKNQDRTICFKCSADFGSQELQSVAGIHVCEGCRRILLDFQYPKWLKTGFALLLLLLVFSLIHGQSYFSAGHAYYRGKKLLDKGNAKAAVPYFQQALTVGSKSPEVVQNTALAYLKAGLVTEASKLVEGRTFEK